MQRLPTWRGASGRAGIYEPSDGRMKEKIESVAAVCWGAALLFSVFYYHADEYVYPYLGWWLAGAFLVIASGISYVVNRRIEQRDLTS